jgi:hypothetical protein
VESGSLIRVDQERTGHFLDQASVIGSDRFWFSDRDWKIEIKEKIFLVRITKYRIDNKYI